MRRHITQQCIFMVIIALCLSAVLGTTIHEAGHAIVFLAAGSKIESIVVTPGIQIYPKLKKVEWTGYMAGLSITESPKENIKGLSLVMGSSANAVASYLLLLITFRLITGWRKRLVLLLTSFILAWDLIGYSLFPALGLRHWIFIGGDYAEPIVGASMLGVSSWLSYSVVFVHFVFYHFLFVKMSSPVFRSIISANNSLSG